MTNILHNISKRQLSWGSVVNNKTCFVSIWSDFFILLSLYSWKKYFKSITKNTTSVLRDIVHHFRISKKYQKSITHRKLVWLRSISH